MTLHKVGIIHNPIAGRPATNPLVGSVASGLMALGHEVTIWVTEGRGHASELAQLAVDSGYELVIAAGGDGTINEVLQALSGTNVILGVIPIGTVNLWAAEAGLPARADLLMRLFHEQPVRRVDVGVAGDRRFLLMASVGLDAAVVQAVATQLKRRIGRWAYAVSLSGLAPAYRGGDVRLSLDGKVLHVRPLMMVIGNTRRYAGRLQGTPHAIADDGLLDLVALTGGRVWNGLPQVAAVMTGIPALRRSMLQRRARSIEIDAEVPLPIQVDGDFYGVTPVRISVLPGALRVIVGPGATPGLFLVEHAEFEARKLRA
ncbi:MAG: diacylglycerol kinase catalytic region [Chloroflexi bacterium]|nr:diacylglycerol kinase catalytic region [Chloroflexota bacterium]